MSSASKTFTDKDGSQEVRNVERKGNLITFYLPPNPAKQSLSRTEFNRRYKTPQDWRALDDNHSIQAPDVVPAAAQVAAPEVKAVLQKSESPSFLVYKYKIGGEILWNSKKLKVDLPYEEVRIKEV